jgi:TonB family protein
MPAQDIPEYRLRHLVEALGDRYGFEAALGRGAFAVVYLVQNLRLERREAIKVMSETYDGDDEFARRFTSESKLVASLDHPNIVKVYDYGEVDGILWYSMQYIDGPTLRDELNKRHRFEPLDAARLGITLLDALEYSHRQGTIHRDIKPSNILLSRRGRPYLMDFGIAKSVRGTAHTMTGSVLGTPAYIAPEQAQSRHIDGRADVYSLGTTLYELVAGHPPFHGGDLLQVLLRRLNEEPEALSLQRGDVDPDFEEIIHRSLERDPADRYASAAEMRDRLLAWVGREGDDLRVEITAAAARPQGLGGRATIPEDPSEALTRRVEDIAQDQGASGGPTRRSDNLSTASLMRRARRRPLLTAALILIACLLTFELTRRWNSSPRQGSAPPLEMAAESLSQEREPTSPDLAKREDASGKEEATSDADAEDLEPVEEGNTTSPPPSLVQQQPLSQQQPRSQQEQPPPRVVAQPAVPTPSSQQVAPPSAIIRRPVKPPRLLSTPDPEVTGELAVLCSGQATVLSLKVGEDGTVERVRVLQSAETSCDEPALEAARRSKFRPALDVDDQPIAASTTIQIRFGEIQSP